MTTRMKVKKFQSQLLATLHLVKESSTAFFQSLLFRMTKIDEIRIMRKYDIGRESIFFTTFFKKLDTGITERGCHPLTLIFCKQGKGSCPYFMRIQWCIFHTTACCYMCSYVFHNRFFIHRIKVL